MKPVGGMRIYQPQKNVNIQQEKAIAQVPSHQDLLDHTPVQTPDRRTLGTTVIGRTGMGKSTFLQQLLVSDIQQGIATVCFDPHGDLTMDVLGSLRPEESKNVFVLAVDPVYPFGLNLYEAIDSSPVARDRTVANVIDTFKRLWSDEKVYYPRLEYVLRSTARMLLDNPQYTMAEIPLMFFNETFRQQLLTNVKNPAVHLFWQDYEARRSFEKIALIESTVNKFDQFLSSEMVRLIVSQSHTTIPFTDLITNGSSLLIYLPIGQLGESVTSFLGSILLSTLSSHIYARTLAQQRPRLHVYIDELQRFSSPSTTGTLLRESRKFNVGVTIALQSLATVDEETRSAVLQTGNLVCFRTIATDAQLLAKQFTLTPTPREQVSKMRLEPNIVEWDEEVWTNETARQRYEEYEHDRDEFWESVTSAEKTLADKKAFSDQEPYQRLQAKVASMRGEWDKAMDLPRRFKQTIHHSEQDGYTPTKSKPVYSPTTLTAKTYGWRGRPMQGAAYHPQMKGEMQLYDLVDGQPRSYADMLDELENTLATLPRFTCIVQSFTDAGEVEEKRIEIKRPDISSAHATHIEEVLARSRKLFGSHALSVENKILARIAPFMQQEVKEEEKREGKPERQQKKPQEKIERGKPYP